MIEIIKQLKKENPYGFTYNLKTKRMVKFGFIVAYKETQNSFTDDDLKKVLEHAKSHDNIVGGWLQEKTGKYFYDSSRVFKDLHKAYLFAIEHEQYAIYDLTRFIEIEIKRG